MDQSPQAHGCKVDPFYARRTAHAQWDMVVLVSIQRATRAASAGPAIRAL